MAISLPGAGQHGSRIEHRQSRGAAQERRRFVLRHRVGLTTPNSIDALLLAAGYLNNLYMATVCPTRGSNF